MEADNVFGMRFWHRVAERVPDWIFGNAINVNDCAYNLHVLDSHSVVTSAPAVFSGAGHPFANMRSLCPNTV